MTEVQELHDALARIAEVANQAMGAHLHSDHLREADHAAGVVSNGVCTPKMLPRRLVESAAETARRENPANAPLIGPLAALGRGLTLEPLRIALMTAKYWGPKPRTLSVSFLDGGSPELRRRIISHMNAWSQVCGINFAETQGTGEVRISRAGGGYWSYLGTDILHIPKNRQTMNLEGFSMNTRESEYHRVVRHETGHTLGFPHEHMRQELVALIDPQKAYDFFLQTQGWDKQTVDQQVLTPLDQASIMATPPDQTSIMCYQLPGSITKSGKPILGGIDINQTDYAFATKLYPKLGHAHAVASLNGEDWDPSEDVDASG